MNTLNPPEPPPHLAIIGGGITGLTTAYYALQEARRRSSSLRCTVLEAARECGGKMETLEPCEGWRVETGPDSFLTQKNDGIDLCCELGLENELEGSLDENRRTYMVHKGAMFPFPDSLRLITPLRWQSIFRSPLFTWRGKARILCEPWIPASPPVFDESVASFVARRYGQEYLERLAGPLLAGICVGDPNRLSVKSLFPSLVEAERQHASLTRAGRKTEIEEPKTHSIFTTLAHGMSSLAAPLQQAIKNMGGTIQCNEKISSLQRKPEGFYINSTRTDKPALRADGVVLAVPAFVAAGLLREPATTLAKTLDTLRYVSSTTISLGMPKDALSNTKGLDGFGFLTTRATPSPILGVSVLSKKFLHRAPPYGVLIRVFLSCDDTEDLVSTARTALRDITGLCADPLFTTAKAWPKGNPQYDVGHENWVRKTREQAAQIINLFLAGSAYDGISLSDCIRAAKTRAPDLLNALQSLGSTRTSNAEFTPQSR